MYPPILDQFLAKMGILGHFRPKSAQTASIFFPLPNSRLKMSLYKKIGPYLRIFFFFKKMFLHPTDFGWFFGILGVLGLFEAKKCANFLNFFPASKFRS